MQLNAGVPSVVVPRGALAARGDHADRGSSGHAVLVPAMSFSGTAQVCIRRFVCSYAPLAPRLIMRFRALLLLGGLPWAIIACGVHPPASARSGSVALLSSSDSSAAAAAVVAYAVDVRLGRWADRAPEVVCVATAFGSLPAIRTVLDTASPSVVAADECALHSSADPPLAPLVRHLPSLRHALILQLSSLEQIAAAEYSIRVRWDAGYDYGGDSRCHLTRVQTRWVVHACGADQPG
jgi:hypothetical protein